MFLQQPYTTYVHEAPIKPYSPKDSRHFEILDSVNKVIWLMYADIDYTVGKDKKSRKYKKMLKMRNSLIKIYKLEKAFGVFVKKGMVNSLAADK